MLRGKDIVCISSLDWDVMWTSKQQTMHRLAQTNRVLHVEEPVTMLAPFKVPGPLGRWRAGGASLWAGKMRLWKSLLPRCCLSDPAPAVNAATGRAGAVPPWAMSTLVREE